MSPNLSRLPLNSWQQLFFMCTLEIVGGKLARGQPRLISLRMFDVRLLCCSKCDSQIRVFYASVSSAILFYLRSDLYDFFSKAAEQIEALRDQQTHDGNQMIKNNTQKMYQELVNKGKEFISKILTLVDRSDSWPLWYNLVLVLRHSIEKHSGFESDYLRGW